MLRCCGRGKAGWDGQMHDVPRAMSPPFRTISSAQRTAGPAQGTEPTGVGGGLLEGATEWLHFVGMAVCALGYSSSCKPWYDFYRWACGLVVVRITVPYCMVCRTIPQYHTIPYHTIPYHTIPYHTIPYHMVGTAGQYRIPHPDGAQEQGFGGASAGSAGGAGDELQASRRSWWKHPGSALGVGRRLAEHGCWGSGTVLLVLEHPPDRESNSKGVVRDRAPR